MVGVAGFEPTASSSRTKRATRLRHTPNDSVKKFPLPGKRGGFLPDFPRSCKRIFGKPKDHRSGDFQLRGELLRTGRAGLKWFGA